MCQIAPSLSNSRISKGSIVLRQPLRMDFMTFALARFITCEAIAAAMTASAYSVWVTCLTLAGSMRSIKSVVVSPARNASLRNVAIRKSRLVVNPWMLVVSMARASLAAASRRVGAWAITLAIIASNSMAMTLPLSTPESNLALPIADGSQTWTGPGEGRKSLLGSSAQSLASMAWPLIVRSSWLKDRVSPSATRICSRTRS